MTRPLHAGMLGATLYVPATRPDLLPIALGRRYPELRSVAFCLEDAVADADVPAALANLRRLLVRLRTSRALHPAAPALFVRPRDASMLPRLHGLPGIDAIDGFILPKICPETLPDHLAGLLHPGHYIMPTIETRAAFDPGAMVRLRDQLATLGDRVLAVRIGGNDLLATMSVRRSRRRTAYDGPLGPVIASLVTTFAPWGFALSAPVQENFGDATLLRAEIERDLEFGLLTKTAIHPAQVAVIHDMYRVAPDDLAAAEAIVRSDCAAVFAHGGAMMEPATHRNWATALLQRARLFGVGDPATERTCPLATRPGSGSPG